MTKLLNDKVWWENVINFSAKRLFLLFKNLVRMNFGARTYIVNLVLFSPYLVLESTVLMISHHDVLATFYYVFALFFNDVLAPFYYVFAPNKVTLSLGSVRFG